MTKGNKHSPKVTAEHSPLYLGIERRRKPRLTGEFPARVQGVDGNGQAFQNDVVADNISSSGIYFRSRIGVGVGTTLFIVVRLPGGASSTDSGPLVAAYAVVVRSEPQANELFGLAVSMKRHKLL